MAGYIGSKASITSSGAERKKTFTITTNTTSLTGLSYTVNQVHVFHNGVRLVDGTDYTATNGTSITLTSAAENGDEVVVISYATFQTSDTVSASGGGTFAGDVNFTGSFTSQGIDDNATSTAMTLDTSGNVGIGNSNPSAFNTLGASDKLVIGDSTDSNLTLFGTTYGSLAFADSDTSSSTAQYAGLIQYYHADNSMQFYTNSSERMRITTDKVQFNVDAKVDADNSHDLGSGGARWKDLYLSSGVYLGGTGAANKLDDYEEGTWVPNVGGTATYSQQSGQYIKIGTLVYVFGKMTITGIGTGSTNHFSGLPFAAAGEATINISKLDNATFNNYYANLRTAGSSLYLCGQDGLDGTWTVNPNFLTTSTFVQFSGTYHTTA